jgi:hypothetical protein
VLEERRKVKMATAYWEKGQWGWDQWSSSYFSWGWGISYKTFWTYGRISEFWEQTRYWTLTEVTKKIVHIKKLNNYDIISTTTWTPANNREMPLKSGGNITCNLKVFTHRQI